MVFHVSKSKAKIYMNAKCFALRAITLGILGIALFPLTFNYIWIFALYNIIYIIFVYLFDVIIKTCDRKGVMLCVCVGGGTCADNNFSSGDREIWLPVLDAFSATGYGYKYKELETLLSGERSITWANNAMECITEIVKSLLQSISGILHKKFFFLLNNDTVFNFCLTINIIHINPLFVINLY